MTAIPGQSTIQGISSAEQAEELEHAQLWNLNITELAGHNIEAHGRDDVNKMLRQGWVLLHIYTLHYHDDGIWRQRPMAILGRTCIKKAPEDAEIEGATRQMLGHRQRH